MNAVFKLMLLAVTSVFLLGGCTEITEAFVDGDPAETSSCEFWSTVVGGGDEFLCVECNSNTTKKASYDYCGAEISARCNSDGPDLFGIAFGVFDGAANAMAAGAWFDDGTPGPSAGDFLVCHEQSGGAFGKQEYKCTTELKGNGKKGGITFEAEIKYDHEKDECS